MMCEQRYVPQAQYDALKARHTLACDALRGFVFALQLDERRPGFLTIDNTQLQFIITIARAVLKERP